MRSRPAKLGAALTVAALGAGVVANTSRARSASPAGTETAVAANTPGAGSLAAPATTTTTVDAVGPATLIDVGIKGLSMGARGPAVLALKQRLAQLRYDPGQIDDRYDYGAFEAVIAFQKVHGMPRNGKATPEVAAAMAAGGLPAAMVQGGEPTRAEIDLTHQVLLFWQDGRLVRILPVSSGFGGHYCGQDGSCGIAVTPVGAYRATSKIRGMHKSPLGQLWDPVFFNQGIAIHGEPAVPAVPASHGCVRIPMYDSVWMFNQLALGTPVYVGDATHIPIAFAAGAKQGPVQPGGTPPTLPHPSTTVAPPPGAPTTTATTTKPH
jgi:peptidoglycan hydrolase-like protein with peptidoglycan-binding domain